MAWHSGNVQFFCSCVVVLIFSIVVFHRRHCKPLFKVLNDVITEESVSSIVLTSTNCQATSVCSTDA